MSREVKEVKTLDDLRYLAERDRLPQEVKDDIPDEDLQKFLRGEKVKLKGFGKVNTGKEEEEGEPGDEYDDMTVAELDAELASRVDADGEPLSMSGNKAEKQDRLRENDALS